MSDTTQSPNSYMPVLISACLLLMLSFGLRSGFGLFLQPMSEANGWGRDVLALALAIQNLSWGVSAVIAGGFVNRFGTTIAGDFFNELKPRISACANQRSGGARIGSTQQRAIILCHSAVMRKNLTYCKLTKAVLGSAGFASATQGQPAPQRRYTNHPAPPKDPQSNALRTGCFADHLAVGASHQAPSLTAPKR